MRSRFKQKTLRKTSCTAAAQTKEVMILYVIYMVLLDAKLCGGGNGIILNGLYVSFLMSCTDHAKTTTISARNAPQVMKRRTEKFGEKLWIVLIIGKIQHCIDFTADSNSHIPS